MLSISSSNAGVQLSRSATTGMPAARAQLRGHGSRGGFKAVHVQRARIHNPCAIEIRGLQQQALVAAAQHGALAAAVDNDQRLRAGGIGHRDEPRIHAGALKFAAMQMAASSSPSLPT